MWQKATMVISSMHLSSHRLWERINQNACMIKLIISEYPNNLSFDLLGFDPIVCLSLIQETALHRCILYLHYSKITHLSYKTKIMIHLLKDCLHLQDEALQTLLHTAAIKLGSGNMADYHFTQRQAWFANSGTSMICSQEKKKIWCDTLIFFLILCKPHDFSGNLHARRKICCFPF